ncbi:probable aminoacyl tRNA synthase complex-interacting multifunctional protein 2 isoform X1 [Stomoxys calcitrans]|uniref:probable aminoacyl tRNA synthase complex-interacting multifunctional protein 2 isoform X1 n=1 Tax=Stomoxys calcitrans TaxID=35570 RepID=UPI0027E2E1B9|nr:probable aminoacyl tRNA synthase complex-interacting multifunctional protein 2 isoform X1 [Stomoxys calcitrans]
MYELKTLLPKFDINLPKCMYEMKNLNTTTLAEDTHSGGHASVSNGFLKFFGMTITPTPTASAVSTCCPLDLDKLGLQIQQILKVSCDDAQSVVQRQEKVLLQLDELKKQLAGIRSTLGLCQKGLQHTSFVSSNNGGLREEPLHDIVINGHPNFIPYALLAMKNAWKELFTIDVKTFTHSTMNDIGKEAKAFEEALKSVPINPALPKVNVTLIWKNCEHTEMISSPTMYVPIYGEVNIIRYLGRVGPTEYRYEDSLLCNEIDAVLDICYQLLRCTTPKSKANMIRTLNNRLQKQQYFGGDKMSIADIGVHSSLRRMPSITDKDLTPSLLEWRKRAAKVTLI